MPHPRVAPIPASDAASAPGPVAIGGLGGSGTRVVAAATRSFGVDLGDDLNPALDNLAFTLLFKDQAVLAASPAEFSQRVRLLVAAMTGTGALPQQDRDLLERLARDDRAGVGRVQHPSAWLATRARNLARRVLSPSEGGPWGWKEPNTHVVLDRLLPELPGLRYVHVTRNALDMAFSRNRNQLLFWGPMILGRRVRWDPRDALAFWCEIDRRVRRTAKAMGDRFLWIDHDVLCREPERELSRLARFLGADEGAVAPLRSLVKPPATTGRHLGHPLDLFDDADLAYLEAIGELDRREGTL